MTLVQALVILSVFPAFGLLVGLIWTIFLSFVNWN